MAVSQSMEALAKANKHRFAVAAKRREIGQLDPQAARQAVIQLLLDCEDPAILSGRVAWYLEAPHRAGPGMVSRVMRDVGIRRHDCRVRDLTMRQRRVLADAISRGYHVDREAA